MNQSEMILDHMRNIGPITALDALREYGCMRLASRIADLKRQGHLISSATKTSTNRFGKEARFSEYWLTIDSDNSPEGCPS